MIEHEAVSSTAAPPGMTDRRSETRDLVHGALWMVDHNGSTVLRCHCVEISPSGMRLRVPLGYGVAQGQRYELRSHLPGSRPIEGFGVIGTRWATVVRAQMRLGEADDYLDVGVTLDATDSSPLSASVTTALV